MMTRGFVNSHRKLMEEIAMLHNVSRCTRPVARRVIGALLCAALVVPAALTTPAHLAHAQTLNVYPLPSGLPSGDASSQWSVTANGQNSGVYSFSSLSYTTFSTDAAVSINATFNGSVSSVVIRPKSYGITPTVNGRTVSFTLSPNQKVSVEVNGGTGNALFVYADPLEVNPPAPNTPGVAYFGPGYHNIGQDWCFPNGATTLYVAGGAYLAGTIYCNGKSNVTIEGRGVLSGEGVPLDSNNSYYGSWLLHNTGGDTMDGLTFVNSQQYGPGTEASSGGAASNMINDIKVINPDGPGGNRTGIFVDGNGTTIQNSFVWAGDDALNIEGRPNETIQNVVVATTGGDAIQLGWNFAPSNDTINNIDVIHYTGGNYAGYQAAIGSIDYCQQNPMHDIMVENVRLEGPLSGTHLFGLHTGRSSFCAYTGPLAPIYNVTFKNISAEQNGALDNGSILAGNDSGSAVHDICFQNLTIGGTLVTSANAGSYVTLGTNTYNIAFLGTGVCPTSGGSSYQASSGFSSMQNQNKWNYYYSTDNEGSISAMTWDSGNSRWAAGLTSTPSNPDYYCLIGSNWQHPGVTCDSVRIWAAPKAGTVTITANGPISVAQGCNNNASGVQVRVYLGGGGTLWPLGGTGWQSIANGSSVGFPSGGVSVNVGPGYDIEFVVQHLGTQNACDTTTWDPIVTYN